MRILALSLCVAFLLTACQTTEKIGNGPISDMPDNIVAAYKNYRRVIEENDHLNMVFAYNKTSRGSGWAGRRQRDGIGHAIEEALELCERGSTAGSCEVFDIDGRIVWKGLDSELTAGLIEPLPVIYDNRTYEYDAGEYRISAAQLKKFKVTSEYHKDYNYTAFFISADGKSSGGGYVDSASPMGTPQVLPPLEKDARLPRPR